MPTAARDQLDGREGGPIVSDLPVDDLLRRYSDEERDKPLRLRTAFGEAYREFFGLEQEPHVQKLQRLVRKGSAGIRLRAIEEGGALYSTRRWLAEFTVAVAEARANSEARDHARSRTSKRKTSHRVAKAGGKAS
ncbi:MAG: hypothetical protein KAI24_18795 [Planctomycetes bacterium]|nr:hypothetical protein [Planctomycetota bacterium]